MLKYYCSLNVNIQDEVLSSDELRLYMELFDSSLRLKHREQFFSWLQGVFQYLFPHEVLICAYRSQSDEPFGYEKFVSTRYFKDEHFTELVDSDNGLLSKMMHAWVKLQHPILIADHLESGDFSAYSIPFQLKKETLDSLEIKNAAAHGVSNGNGEILAFFFFARLDPKQNVLRQAYLLELFTPHFHSILTRILTNIQLGSSSFNVYRSKNVKHKAHGSRITHREQEILKWMQAGKTNQEIAQILDISPLTVKNHVHNILKKLGVENRSNACHKAKKLGLIN